MSKKGKIHTFPVDDLDIHVIGSSCWCHPLETEPGLYIHNAKDCREVVERRTHKNKGKGWEIVREAI